MSSTAESFARYQERLCEELERLEREGVIHTEVEELDGVIRGWKASGDISAFDLVRLGLYGADLVYVYTGLRLGGCEIEDMDAMTRIQIDFVESLLRSEADATGLVLKEEAIARVALNIRRRASATEAGAVGFQIIAEALVGHYIDECAQAAYWQVLEDLRHPGAGPLDSHGATDT